MSIHYLTFDNNCTKSDVNYANMEETNKQIIPKKRTTKRKKKRTRAYCSICMKYFASNGSQKVHMKNMHITENDNISYLNNIIHTNSFHRNSVPKQCDIKINEQHTNSILSSKDSRIGPSNQQLDNPTRSNKIQKIVLNEPPESSKSHIKDNHSNTIYRNVLKEFNLNKKKQKKRKRSKIYSCSLCKKIFSTTKSYKIHLSRCHDTEASKQLVTKKRFNKYSSQMKSIKRLEDFWEEFDNNMPVEFKHDNGLFYCYVCNVITTKGQSLDHQKDHYSKYLLTC